MQKDDAVYVGHMCDMARKAIDKTASIDRTEFDGDENLRLAVTHLLQVIGEAAARVSDGYRKSHPDVPWAAIVGMRNKVVHDYLNVDDDIVWDTARNDLPALLATLESIPPESQ